MDWDAVRYRTGVENLIGHLEGERVLTDRVWRAALHEVPRHHFVPTEAYAKAMFPGGVDRAIHRRRSAVDWWNAVYSNCSIITQRDEGLTAPADPAGTPTCSLSCPHIAMEYLHLLNLGDHHRVLEIGTGTGWTAAMLAWRTRPDQVTTIEVDEALAKTATDNLEMVHLTPHLVVADGADGHPDGGPYDRVHVTCGIRDIPPAWIAQTKPGGRIVLPWMPIGGQSGGHQLVLTVEDPEHALGRFTGGGGFMMLRSQRRGAIGGGFDPASVSTTDLDPRLISEADGGLALVLAAMIPGLTVESSWEEAMGVWTEVVRLADGTGSWAKCALADGEATTVMVGGDRHLWQEAHDAYMWWLRNGQPERDRFGLTVDLRREGVQQAIWLDVPVNIVPSRMR